MEVQGKGQGQNAESNDHRQEEENAQEEPAATEQQLETYNLARDRQRRMIRPPQRFGHADLICYALNTAEEVEHEEPKSYKEAIKSKDKTLWLEAMKEELYSLSKNQTWTLVERPKNQRVVGCRWLFKRKEGISGSDQPRYKARLVAKGYSQVQGVDFNEIYSPVVKHCSIRIILSLVAQFDLELEQLDVKTAFLHGDLEETIYMDQPEGEVKP